MDWKEYKYYAQLSGDDMVYRPIVGVVLSTIKDSIETIGIIDSGCDYTLINAEYAEELGITPATCETAVVGGIADKGTPSFIAKIKLRIEGFEDIFEVNARFVPGMVVNVLLGEVDFFENFKVLFEKRQRKFSLIKSTS